MVVCSNGCISTPFPAAINSVTVHVWEEEVVLLVQFEMKEVIISIPCANIISLYISIYLSILSNFNNFMDVFIYSQNLEAILREL